MISLRDRAPVALGAAPGVGSRTIPVEIQDAVQTWARSTGKRSARMYWSNAQCPVVEIALKDDDPRMKAWYEGKVPTKPKDAVFFHRQVNGRFEPLNLDEMGVSGVVRYLEEADLTTGRGKWRSMEDYLREALGHNERVAQKAESDAVENARLRARDERRRVAGEPLVPVAANISTGSGT